MDAILGFMSDLILFTAGLLVCFLWLVIICVILIETWDAIFESDEDEEDGDA